MFGLGLNNPNCIDEYVTFGWFTCPSDEVGGGSSRDKVILPPRPRSEITDIQDISADLELVTLALIAIEEIERNNG